MDASAAVLVETGLRVVGAFYALTAPLVLRQAALGQVLTQALTLLGATRPEERRAEIARTVILSVNSVAIGIGGIWLAVLAQLAVWLYLACAIFYGLYLAWIAPRWLDPHDPPEEPGRSQARNAFLVYAVATTLVLAAHANGLLKGTAALGDMPFWSAVILSVGLVAYAASLFLPWRSTGPMAPIDVEGDASGHEETRSWAAERAIMTPSWHGSGLFDAETGETIHAIAGMDLTDEDLDRIGAWNDLFRSLADPDDPWRAALKDPADQARITQQGRAIYDDLLARAGPDKIAFEPIAAPLEPIIHPDGVKVMADYATSALWHDGGGAVGDIDPGNLSLSWSLSCALNEWSLDFDESIDWSDPGGEPLWTPERYAEHDRRGAELAARVADEFARTGRADVPVRYSGHGPATDSS
jgi:hypothetical protein